MTPHPDHETDQEEQEDQGGRHPADGSDQLGQRETANGTLVTQVDLHDSILSEHPEWIVHDIVQLPSGAWTRIPREHDHECLEASPEA